MDGVIVVNKPVGMTSHDVVAKMRRILGERRIGHTGTLDPFATGVLVLLIGKATRLAQFLNNSDKEYEAIVRFGFATDTADVTGTPLPDSFNPEQIETISRIGEADLNSVLSEFRGTIEQTPPMYSAKKIDGKKLYELARKGEEVARKAVPVTISILEILPPLKSVPSSKSLVLSETQDGTFDLRIRVVCSAGTYIRTLAEDIGARLGVGAHLAALCRTRAGKLGIDNSFTLQDVQNRVQSERNLRGVILSPQSALSDMHFVHLSDGDVDLVRHGRATSVAQKVGDTLHSGEMVGLLGGGDELIAIGVFNSADNTIRPRIVLTSQN